MQVQPDPFPHAVVDALWLDADLDGVLAEFPDVDHHLWRRYNGVHETGKLEGSDPRIWGDRTRAFLELLRSPALCGYLGEAFDIPHLEPDTIGGGYHCIVTGGKLDVHADFSVHPTTGLYRRLNLLVYLNHGWEPAHGGELHLGADNDIVVAPLFGRTVVFATSGSSWHGHPTPWNGPQPRRSIAVYYYAPTPPAGFAGAHSTVWR